ncbi:cephalotocin receptor 2 [Hydra vulgaris]|uniref:cephalotocin receptor 2 n=1 Tax=Hydra vulgaris TaxID=6087 RepID=UPI000640DFDF|nr:cephalotocin receptor 2 [Hydra vulgaris]
MIYHWSVIVRIVFYVIFFVCGLIGNIMIVLFFSIKMKKTSHFRWFIVHLAIADCFYAVVSPIHLIYLLATNEKWTIGTELCKILTISGPLSVNVSAWILCLMGYERYRVVCHPFARRFSKKMIHISVGLVWIACIGLKVFTYIRIRVTNNECYVHFNDVMEQTVNAGLSLLAEGIVPFIFLTYYFVRVTITMRKRSLLFETKDDNSVFMRSECLSKQSSSSSSVLHKKGPESNCNKISLNSEHVTKSKQQLSFNSDNNLLRVEQKAEIDIKESDVNIYDVSKKLKSPKWESLKIKQSAFKLVISPSFTRISSLNKADRATIIVFFMTVLMFMITTFPERIFYFVACYLFSFRFNKEQIFKYGPAMKTVNEWLGFLLLSGCLSDVIVYSGKYPDFRQQSYRWINYIITKLTSKLNFRKKNNETSESTL